jgi:hypothetical protein
MGALAINTFTPQGFYKPEEKVFVRSIIITLLKPNSNRRSNWLIRTSVQ